MKARKGKHASILVTILIGSMVMAGCGGDGGGEEDADAADDGVTEEMTDPGMDDAAEIPPDDGGGEDPIEDEGGGVALTVLVQEKLSDGTLSPIEGATVALDAPGGGRTEDFTGADGRVTFTGLDFSLGLATATAHKVGYYLRTIVTAGEGDGELGITLARNPSDFIEVSGTAENIEGTMHSLFVSSSVTPHQVWEAAGPDWLLPVKPGVPFSLSAVEYAYTGADIGRVYSFTFFGWAVVEHDAITGPTEIVLDFSSPPATTHVEGSFALPSRPESVFRDMGKALVHVRADHAYSGFSSLTDLSADGESYEYQAEYVEVPGTAELKSEYIAHQGFGESAGLTYAIVSGAPMAGANDFGHLDMPDMISPEGPLLIDAQPLHDPIEWEIFDSGVTVIIRIYLEPNWMFIERRNPGIWEVELPPDSTTAVLPELPSTVDAGEFFNDEPIVFGRVWLHQAPDSGEVLERWSSGIRFRLAP